MKLFISFLVSFILSSLAYSQAEPDFSKDDFVDTYEKPSSVNLPSIDEEPSKEQAPNDQDTSNTFDQKNESAPEKHQDYNEQTRTDHDFTGATVITGSKAPVEIPE